MPMSMEGGGVPGVGGPVTSNTATATATTTDQSAALFSSSSSEEGTPHEARTGCSRSWTLERKAMSPKPGQTRGSLSNKKLCDCSKYNVWNKGNRSKR